MNSCSDAVCRVENNINHSVNFVTNSESPDKINGGMVKDHYLNRLSREIINYFLSCLDNLNV